MDKVLKYLPLIAITITISTFVLIISYILISGIPNLSLSLFQFQYNSENVSAFSSIISTILMVFFTLLITVPFGLFTAIYMVEYAKKGSVFVKVIRLTTETLAGIPSIIFGLFGMLFFVTYLNFNYSFIAGCLTLSIMILPLIIRTTEESLIAVPSSYREGAYGLGAGKMATVFKIVLPSAIPSILGGVILSIGRIVGETAALIFTAGTVAQIPTGLGGEQGWFFEKSARTLSTHMYILSGEGLHIKVAQAIAVILLVVVIFINVLSVKISKIFSKE